MIQNESSAVRRRSQKVEILQVSQIMSAATCLFFYKSDYFLTVILTWRERTCTYRPTSKDVIHNFQIVCPSCRSETRYVSVSRFLCNVLMCMCIVPICIPKIKTLSDVAIHQEGSCITHTSESAAVAFLYNIDTQTVQTNGKLIRIR